jgi:hypothetical protein
MRDYSSIFKCAISLCLMLGIFPMLQGCTVNDATPAPQATVQSNFFPLENGLLYTYGRTTNFTKYDTISCWLFTVQPPAILQNVLEDTVTKAPFYSFVYSTDADGNPEGILSTDTSTLIALDGNLQDSATWVADEAHGIHATVVAQYDDYYLPGRQEDFADVLAVEYHQDGQPADIYTLRFFARGYGLILEREFGPSSEISRLQLISVRYPS